MVGNDSVSYNFETCIALCDKNGNVKKYLLPPGDYYGEYNGDTFFYNVEKGDYLWAVNKSTKEDVHLQLH